MDLVDGQICILDGPLCLRDIMSLQALDRRDLKEAPFVPFVPPSLDVEGRALFEAIRHRDILLHHPYDAFSPVIDLLRAATRDPDVLAIKMTLYLSLIHISTSTMAAIRIVVTSNLFFIY